MGFRVETGLLNPDKDQYAGDGGSMMNLAFIASEAARLESLGFDSIAVPEAGHDPFLALVVAAEHTERVELATNVAISFPRSPMVTAQMAWDLQQYSDGRFVLGLGTQVKGHNKFRYATAWDSPPGPRMREYLECLQAIYNAFAGADGPTTFEGEHYTFTMLLPFFNPGPIDHALPGLTIAAVNPYMCRLAGELCDGVRLHPIGTFSYQQEVVQPLLEKGAERAGRPADQINRIGAPFVAVGRNDEEIASAREALKQAISFYASTRTYHGILDHHGWQDAGAELHRLSKQGGWKEMPAIISDDMLDQWAITTSWDDFAVNMTERCRGVYDTVLVDFPPQLSRDEDHVRQVVADLKAA